MTYSSRWIAVSAALALTGCAATRTGLVGSPALSRHFAQGKITDVTLVVKDIGKTEVPFGKDGRRGLFLEGAIEGALTEWDGAPAAGVSLRLAWDGWANPVPASGDDDTGAPGMPLAPSLSTDEADPRASVMVDARGGSAVTDMEGRYRVPFSVPVLHGRVEAAGRLVVAPEWESHLEKMGRAYEPFSKEIPFQLFFYRKEGILAYNEGYDRRAVRVAGGHTLQTRAPSESAADQKRLPDKSAEYFIELQLMIVNKRLEKQVLLSKVAGGIKATFAGEDLFEGTGDKLSKSGTDILRCLAAWFVEKKCGLFVPSFPNNRGSLAARRSASIKKALQDGGVSQGSFFTKDEGFIEHQVTVWVYPAP